MEFNIEENDDILEIDQILHAIDEEDKERRESRDCLR